MNLKPYPKYKDSGIEWLGKIPERWEVKRLKYVCNEYAEYGLNIEAEKYQSEGIRFIRTTDLDDYGNLRNEGVYINPLLAKDYILKDGDLLISRSGTIGRSFLYESSKNEEATYAGYLVRYSPDSEKAFPKYLFYFTLSHSFYEWLKTQLVESTIGNVNGQKYANISLPIPPKEEQIRLSTFLDHKTSKIDELVKKNERLIDLLKEKRQALISQAVTKGLDPNAKMKDSGIEWIKEIPEGWRVFRLKHLAGNNIDVVQTGPFGAQLHASDYVDKGVPLILIRNVNNLWIDDSNIPKISEEKAASLSMYCLKAGDIVFSRVGSIGRIALVTEREEGWLISGQMLRIRIKNPRLDNHFLLYVVSSNLVSEFIQFKSVGSTRDSINTDILRNVYIPIPPSREQESITNFLDQKTAQIERLITKIQSQIAALKEYRQALISNVVTGKVRVN